MGQNGTRRAPSARSMQAMMNTSSYFAVCYDYFYAGDTMGRAPKVSHWEMEARTNADATSAAWPQAKKPRLSPMARTRCAKPGLDSLNNAEPSRLIWANRPAYVN